MTRDWAEQALTRFELAYHPQRAEWKPLLQQGISWRRIASLYPFDPAAYPAAIKRSIRRASSSKVRALLRNFDLYSESFDRELRGLVGDDALTDDYFFGPASSSFDHYHHYLVPTHLKALGIVERHLLDRSENYDRTGVALSLYALPRTLHNIARLGGVAALPQHLAKDLPGLKTATEATVAHLRLK